MAKNRWRSGDYNVISDISGFKFKRSECILVNEPGSIIDGLMVHKSEYSPRNIQNNFIVPPDDISIADPRPRQPTVFVEGQGPNDLKRVFPSYASFPGNLGDTCVTADSVANSVQDSFTIVAEIEPADFTVAARFISKSDPIGDNSAYSFGLAGNSDLSLFVSDDGTDTNPGSETYQTVSIPFGNRTTIAVEYDLAANTAKFYESVNDEFVLLETVVGTQPITAIFDSTLPVNIGSISGNSELFNGVIYRVQLLDGKLDGDLVMDFNPTDFVSGDSFISQTTGETWSILGDVKIIENPSN